MISFSCPKCRAGLQRQDAEAGTKVLCPSCNQKLLVPTPPRLTDKTMFGELETADSRMLVGEPLPATLGGRSQLPVQRSSGLPVLASPAAGTPIRCVCPHCNAVIKADPRRAGSRASCPGCGCPVEIPLPKAELLEDVQVVQAVVSVPAATQPPRNTDLFALTGSSSSPSDYGSRNRKSGSGSSVLVVTGLAVLLVVGLCGGFGLVAIISSSNRASQQFEGAPQQPAKRFTESDARAKLRQPLDLWVSQGAIVLSNTKLPGIEFDDPDLGPAFILLHYAMGSVQTFRDSWWITVDMTFRSKTGGQVVLRRKYEVKVPNENNVVRIFVVSSETTPRLIPD